MATNNSTRAGLARRFSHKPRAQRQFKKNPSIYQLFIIQQTYLNHRTAVYQYSYMALTSSTSDIERPDYHPSRIDQAVEMSVASGFFLKYNILFISLQAGRAQKSGIKACEPFQPKQDGIPVP